MKTVKIIIEKTKDMYSAYAENVNGVYGGGDTVENAKQSVLDAIRLLKEHNDAKNIPTMLKGDYKIVYKWDVASLINSYKGILTPAGLEKLTGIAQRQIQHYSSGLKKPRQEQVKKIENGLHKFGEELIAVELG